MLAGHAHTLRQKARLAVSLAWVAGFIDAVGFILIGSFLSNMTGNTALIGERLFTGEFGNARFCAFLVLMFVAGAVLSSLLTEIGRRRGIRSIYALVLGVEVFATLLFVVLTVLHVGPFLLRAAILPLAMGLQNATITQIAGSVVRTTHVTGVLTDLGIESVHFAFWFRDRTRGQLSHRIRRAFFLSRRHPSVQRLFLLVSIWGSFALGAGLGAIAYVRLEVFGLFFPIAFLFFMVVLNLIQPIARVRIVDHAKHDDELRRFGIDPGLLPRSVSIFRIDPGGRSDARLPDLSQIGQHADRRRLKVLILILPADVTLNDNHLAGLENSLKDFRAHRRTLIVCTSTMETFLKIRESSLGSELGLANLCSDPEFAVARAIEVLSR